MTDDERWFVYVLRCKGGRLYCGITTNVEARFAEHAAGSGAKFTRAFPPEEVLAYRAVVGKSRALRDERAFKALKRAQKLACIARWKDPAGQ